MSKRLEELVEKVDNIGEEKIRENFIEIMYRYGSLGAGGYNEQQLIKDIKNIYIDVVVRPHMEKAWGDSEK